MTFIPTGIQNVGQLFLHLVAKLSKRTDLNPRWRSFDANQVPMMVAGLAACHTNRDAKQYALSYEWFRREWNFTRYSRAFDQDGVRLANQAKSGRAWRRDIRLDLASPAITPDAG